MNSQDKNALFVFCLVVAVICLIVGIVVYNPMPEAKPVKSIEVKLPAASKVGEKVGQTSGNFVQGFFKGLFKSTKDGK